MYSNILKRGSLFLFSSMICASWVGVVAAQLPAQAELKGAFNERMSPDVVVSGAVVVGVSSAAHFDGGSLAALAVFPSPGMGTVCLTVETHDGVYTSRNEYAIPQGLNARVPVRLPYERSRYLGELSQYQDHGLALKATPGGCSDETAGGRVLPLQRIDQLGNRDLRFYINAIGATDIFISTEEREGYCQPVSGRQTSFDHICQIALPTDADTAQRHITVRVDRERYGRELPSATVIVLPVGVQ